MTVVVCITRVRE